MKPRDGRTVLDGLRQAGSLKMLFPRVFDGAFQGVLVNTAGGVTGGDQFLTQIALAAGTQLTVTTQAAERAYRAQPGETGSLETGIQVAAGARLCWLPQETIVFQGAALRRRLRVDLAPEAHVLLCEPLVFGRAAMGEVVTDALFADRIEIWRAGVPLFLDRLCWHGNIAAELARPTVANGAAAMACAVYVADDALRHLEPLRAMLGPTAGVSLIRPDVLFLRVLAADGFLLREILMPALTRLSGAPLPRPWMI